jgi:hypothetical protein
MLRILLAVVASTVPAPALAQPQPVSRAPPVANDNIGPEWSRYDRPYDAHRVTIGGLPLSAQFGSGTVGTASAITGGIEVPASSNGGNHSAGMSGYARTSSRSQGAVGAFGMAMASANGTSVWGMNTITTNAAAHLDQTGFTDVIAYGIELDLNIRKLPDGSAPNVPTRGLYMIGDSNTQTLGISRAVDVDKIGTYQNIPWKEAFHTVDGGALVGLNLGTVSDGVSGSQPILLRARAPDGTARGGQIALDPSGNFVLTPSGGAGLGVIDTAGQRSMFVSRRLASFSGAIQVASQPPTRSDAPCQAGTLTWDARFTYVCVAQNTWKRAALADW